MSKDKMQISQVRYGELHLYYPIKFDTKLSYEELCAAIAKSKASYNDEYQKKVMDEMGNSFANTTSEFQQNNPDSDVEGGQFTFKVRDWESDIIYEPNHLEPAYDINGQNIRIELVPSDTSFKMKIISTEIESLQRRLNRLSQEFELSDRIYGKAFTANQERIILLPFKAILESGAVVWVQAILFVFRNNMGILKIEIPLIDADVAPLKAYDMDSLVKSLQLCWKDNPVDENMTLSQLPDYYLKSIAENNRVEITKYNNDMRHILFIDFDEMPKQINNLSSELQEELYRIVSAPVPDHPYTSYVRDAREHLENFSWGNHGMKYVVKTNGGMLSIIDRGLWDYYFEGYKECNGILDLTRNDYLDMCNQLATNINSNVEFAILILMLKKTNEANNLYGKLQRKQNLSHIQKEYYQNVLFINQLQSSCYGTVTEQTVQLEKMMSQYLRADLTQSNQNALDYILKEEEQQKNEQFINFISIGSFILSLVFGLPSIYEALCILRKIALAIIPYDVPYITLEAVSVILWILLNLYIGVQLLRKGVARLRKK